MNMKYEDECGTDFLIALWLIRRLASEYTKLRSNAHSQPATGSSAQWANYERLLNEILWGHAGFGRSEKQAQYPLEALLMFCHERGLNDLPCELTLRDQDGGLYASTTALREQMELTDDGEKTFNHLKASAELYKSHKLEINMDSDSEESRRWLRRSTVYTTLGESYEFALALVQARRELMERGKQAAANDDQQAITIPPESLSRDYRPVTVRFSSVTVAMQVFADSLITERLESFVTGGIDHRDTVLKWRKQREMMRSFLQERSRDNMECWCSYEDFTSTDYLQDSRPLETLLALEMEGGTAIEDIEADAKGELRFKIDLSRMLRRAAKKEVGVDAEIQWLSYCDFLFCHKPLLLSIHGKLYNTKSKNPKATDEDTKRRKALRTIALFIPKKRNVYLDSFTGMHGLAKKLKIKGEAAETYVSITRGFLKKIGSDWTISSPKDGDIRIKQVISDGTFQLSEGAHSPPSTAFSGKRV